MNTAARLEQAAGAGEVLVGQSTWRLVHHAVELEPLMALGLKGKADSVPAWRLVSSVPAAGPPVEAPLVGRVNELGRLQSALVDAISAGACRLVSVIGLPGVGKTRLARELARAVGDQARVVVGRCQPTGEGIT
jgi:hypothetical protein